MARNPRRRHLVKMEISDILKNWRPGSYEWDWYDERIDLLTRDRIRTNAIRNIGRKVGFDFADHKAPIELGNDGRVWNGHHRIVAAIEEGVKYLMVWLAPNNIDSKGNKYGGR